MSGFCGCGRGHPLGVSLSLASLAVCIEFAISETRAPALFHPRRGNGLGSLLALQLRGGPGQVRHPVGGWVCGATSMGVFSGPHLGPRWGCTSWCVWRCAFGLRSGVRVCVCVLVGCGPSAVPSAACAWGVLVMFVAWGGPLLCVCVCVCVCVCILTARVCVPLLQGFHSGSSSLFFCCVDRALRPGSLFPVRCFRLNKFPLPWAGGPAVVPDSGSEGPAVARAG